MLASRMARWGVSKVNVGRNLKIVKEIRSRMVSQCHPRSKIWKFSQEIKFSLMNKCWKMHLYSQVYNVLKNKCLDLNTKRQKNPAERKETWFGFGKWKENQPKIIHDYIFYSSTCYFILCWECALVIMWYTPFFANLTVPCSEQILRNSPTDALFCR